jgi:tetratricopeptide (TPR) repeat protein
VKIHPARQAPGLKNVSLYQGAGQMKSFRLRTHLLILLFSLSIAIPASAQDNWLNLRTKNFNVITDANDKDARILAERLEVFRFVISKIFNSEPVSPVPLAVIAFKSDAAFTPYKPIYKDQTELLVAGYFLPDADQNMIALDLYANHSRPLSVVFHEYTHLLTNYTPARLPLWLTEGVAEFYSTFASDNKKVSIGIPIRQHVLLLRNSHLMPLQDLFATDEKSPAYHEGDKAGIFYAESWALVHYLMMGDKSSHQADLRKFISLVATGEKTDAAFTAAFNTTYAAMEKELHRYTQNDVYPGFTYTLDTSFAETQVAARQISEAEARCYLGALLLRSRREKEAEDYFKQAVGLDPKLSRAYEGLGRVQVSRTNYEAAKELFRKAIELDQANFVAHYQYAAMLWATRQDQASVSNVAEEIRSEARKSARLVPGYVRPYTLLTDVSLATGEGLKEGLVAISNAIKLEPQNKWFQLRRAEVQARLDDIPAAKKSLEPLVSDDADHDLQLAARSLLDSISRNLPTAPPTLSRSSVPDDRDAEELEAQASQAVTARDYQKAIDLYRRLPKSRETQAHLGLAFSYLKLRNYKASLEHATEASKRDPANARAHALIALSLLRSGSLEQAGAEVKRALELDPNNSLAYQTWAEIDFYEGRFDQSRSRATRAQTFGADDPDLWLLISEIAERTDSFDEAEQAFTRFVKSAAQTTDESRARNNAVIEFYHRLSAIKTYQITGPTFTHLPFKLGRDRRPYVKVRLNGVEATFRIGSSSGLSTVSTSMAKRLGMPLIQRGNTQAAVNPGAAIQFSVVDSLELGDLKITSVPCFVRDLEDSNVPGVKPPDGVLGLSLLYHFVFQLDFKGNEIGLALSEDQLTKPRTAKAVVIPLRTTRNSIMSIEMELEGGQRANAVLDIETVENYISRTAVDSFKSGNAVKPQPGKIAWPHENTELVLGNCRIAGLNKKDLRVIVYGFDAMNKAAGFEQSVVLGQEFLRDFRVTVDHAHGHLILDPYKD